MSVEKLLASRRPDGGVATRLVRAQEEPQAGEVEIAIVPGVDPGPQTSSMVWDDTNGPRNPTSVEALQKARVEQESIVRDAANAHYEATTRSFEGAIVAAKYGRGGLTALNAEERIVFDTMNADYVRLKGLIVNIRQATTIETVRAVAW